MMSGCVERVHREGVLIREGVLSGCISMRGCVERVYWNKSMC